MKNARERVRGFVTGVLATLTVLLVGVVAVSAATSRNITVTYRNIQVFVNGAPRALAEEPFIFNDRVFVALSDVAQVLGVPTRWDGATSSIHIGQAAGQAPPTIAPQAQPAPAPIPAPAPAPVTLGRDIRAFRLVGTQEFSRSNPGRIMGIEHEYGFRVRSNNGAAYFNIGGQYTSMSGIFSPLDDVQNRTSTILRISGDGRTLATFEISSSDPASPFNVDVTGVTQLRIGFDGVGHGIMSRNFGVANVTLR